MGAPPRRRQYHRSDRSAHHSRDPCRRARPSQHWRIPRRVTANPKSSNRSGLAVQGCGVRRHARHQRHRDRHGHQGLLARQCASGCGTASNTSWPICAPTPTCHNARASTGRYVEPAATPMRAFRQHTGSSQIQAAAIRIAAQTRQTLHLSARRFCSDNRDQLTVILLRRSVRYVEDVKGTRPLTHNF